MGGGTKAINGSSWTKRERELAIEKGSYHEGVPAILSLWVEAGARGPKNTLTMPSPARQSSLAMRLGSFSKESFST